MLSDPYYAICARNERDIEEKFPKRGRYCIHVVLLLETLYGQLTRTLNGAGTTVTMYFPWSSDQGYAKWIPWNYKASDHFSCEPYRFHGFEGPSRDWVVHALKAKL
jgi:hypothetical protein